MDGMLREMPSKLLAEWQAFFSLEPFGYESDFQGHALTASIIAEANRNPAKRKDPYTVAEFMPKQSKQEEEEQPSVFKRLKEYFRDVNNRQTSSKT